MSLTTPPSVQKLQTALHDKAKGSPKFCFYVLSDKVYRQGVLLFAYDCQTQVLRSGLQKFSEHALHNVLSLLCLTARTRSFPWATS